jgi:glutamate---cysteine ligase / carboxylate-amine ligase
VAHRDDPNLRRSERESRAQRLGFALRGLAADLVSERRKVAELRRRVAELTSRLASLQAAQGRNQAEPAQLLRACPPWARWNGERERRYTLGVEEELMLLEPESGVLAQSSDRVLAALSDELSLRASPETHAAVIELRTGIHTNVDGVVGELAALRCRLAHELGEMGLSAAAAGTYPLRTREETMVSGAARYRMLGDSLRSLARREPTMALHVHVGVPEPEDAIRVLNGLRRSVPVLLALSANSPFSQGRDGGFDSMRTVIFQAFPRTGLPRSFAGYADYVDALDAVIGPGAVTAPSFFWWDVRPQPKLGTVEARVMDAQSTVADVTPLVALIQSLSRLELEGDSQPAPNAEALAENRFLAARDGMDARLIEPATGRLVPVRAILDTMLAECRPHALALGCASELEQVRLLAASNGAHRQRTFTAANDGLDHLVPNLADLFLTPDWHPSTDATSPPTRRTTRPKGAGSCAAGSILGIPDPPQRSALHPGPLPG